MKRQPTIVSKPDLVFWGDQRPTVMPAATHEMKFIACTTNHSIESGLIDSLGEGYGAFEKACQINGLRKKNNRKRAAHVKTCARIPAIIPRKYVRLCSKNNFLIEFLKRFQRAR
jgi:hypothetical protein